MTSCSSNSGLEEVHGDLFLDGGIIKAIGAMGSSVLATHKNVAVVYVKGKCILLGYVQFVFYIDILILMASESVESLIFEQLQKSICISSGESPKPAL